MRFSGGRFLSDDPPNKLSALSIMNKDKARLRLVNKLDNNGFAMECISESIKLEIMLGFSILFWDTRKEGKNS